VELSPFVLTHWIGISHCAEYAADHNTIIQVRMGKNPTTLYTVDLQVILYIIYTPHSWNTIIYIVFEVIAGFDFNA